MTDLYDAAKDGDLATCRALIENGADVNATYEGGWTPLGLKRVRNLSGGDSVAEPLANPLLTLPSIKLRKGSGNKAPAVPRKKVRRSIFQLLLMN